MGQIARDTSSMSRMEDKINNAVFVVCETII